MLPRRATRQARTQSLVLATIVVGALLATGAAAGSATAASGSPHRAVREPRPAHAAAPPSALRITAKLSARAGSTVTMVSESGDWVGGGTSRFWRTRRDTITTGGGGSLLGVSVSGGGGDFTLDFSAPDGKQLRPGVYNGAVRYPFQSAGQPGLDVSGDGRGCNEVAGRFWVLDINKSRSRVWVVYEEHCEGGRPAVFGEIRVGEPNSGAALVSPSRVRWPDDYPGVPLRPVLVHVVNRGTNALTVSGASVVAGGSDFSVLSDDCGELASGGECTVYVGFTPSVGGSRLGELRLSTSVGHTWIPLQGYGKQGQTFWEMHSDPGDWVGGGRDFSWTPRNGAQIAITGSETYVGASVTAGDDWYDADFEAAPGTLLLPGTTFDHPTRYPFNAGAGMAIYGDGAGCNEDTGSFTVQDSAFTDSGRLKRLLLDFTQYCDGSTAALTGTISWNEPDPNAPARDTTAPGAAFDVKVHARHDGRVTLGWHNPSNADWVDTSIRILPGRHAPRRPDSGQEFYTGRGARSTLHVSTAHSRYTVSIFTRDESGNLTRRTRAVRLP